MVIKSADSFIKCYKPFYFKEEIVDYDEYGIPKEINKTTKELENHICKKLYEGTYDIEAFAWKAGKADWNDDGFGFMSPFPRIVVNGNGGIIRKSKSGDALSKNEFGYYIEKKELQKVCVDEDLKGFYETIKNKIDLYGFGSVNIINVMFFLSKGAVPIYDYFAHLAVKALFADISPVEVYLQQAPGKNEHPRGKGKMYKNEYLAVNALKEYMWLLKSVFPNEIKKDRNMYITRDLDQALWVYGHAVKKYKDL